MTILRLSLCLGLLLYTLGTASAQLAFPGAEGFGRNTSGGRGNGTANGRTVYHVINRNDSGLGSLRYGLETLSGPRIIIFDVSGYITTVSNEGYEIFNGNGTIAGQTAPAPGISLKGNILIRASNVIVRYMRIRLGSCLDLTYSGCDENNHYGIVVLGTSQAWESTVPPLRNIIVDHSSVAWGLEGMMGALYNAGPVTFQWSIFAEAVEYGGLDADGNPQHRAKGCGFGEAAQITSHHNLHMGSAVRNCFSHGGGRGRYRDVEVPAFADEVDYVNNVWYDYHETFSVSDYYGPTHINFVGNTTNNTGPGYAGDNFGHPLTAECTNPGWWVIPDSCAQSGAFVQGNRSNLYRPNDTLPEQNVVEFVDRGAGLFPIKDVRWDFPPVITHTAEVAKDLILDNAGATIPQRDAVDTRVTQDVRNLTGTIVSFSVLAEAPGGYPPLDATARDPDYDFDGDGLPDQYELANGYNPTIDDSYQITGEGYSRLEHFLNSTTPVGPGGPSKGPFFIANDGTDAIDCDAAKDPATPRRKLGNVTPCALGGSRIQFREGTHLVSHATDANPIAAGVSVSEPTILESYLGETATLRHDGSGEGILWFANPTTDHYITLNNLMFDCNNVTNKFGIAFSGGGDHLILQGSEVRNCTWEAVIVQGDHRVEILDNVFRDGGATTGLVNIGGCTDCLVHRNTFLNGAGTHALGPSGGSPTTNLSVQRNRIHNNTGVGILLPTGTGTLVANNLIYNNGGDGIEVQSGTNTPKIYYNSTYANQGFGLRVGATATGVQATGNIWWLNTAGTISDAGTATAQTANWTSPDPYENAALGNFDLAANSGARVGGPKVADVTTDFDGTGRPHPTHPEEYSRGAKEASAPESVVTPPVLSIRVPSGPLFGGGKGPR